MDIGKALEMLLDKFENSFEDVDNLEGKALSLLEEGESVVGVFDNSVAVVTMEENKHVNVNVLGGYYRINEEIDIFENAEVD